MSQADAVKSPVENDEERYDQVICAEDLFGEPIKLTRPDKPQDNADANDGNSPLITPIIRGDIVPAFGDLEVRNQHGNPQNAGSILMLDAPPQDEVEAGNEISIHQGQNDAEKLVNVVSASVKAFFGADKDSVDAGQEAVPRFEYNMNHKHRGCFIIFNHMHFQSHLGVNSRKGTEEDKKNLEKTAKNLGFEYIRSFDDLNAQDIFKWTMRIASSDHSDYDCFAMAILTHGDEGDILYAHDAKYHIDAITEPFMAKNCLSLAGKPKMFFIQACRGVMLDHGSVIPVANKTEKEVVVIPNAADFLLAFSTVPGYYAWRNQACGSWFVQALCKCLTVYGDRLELMQIMTRVNRMVAYDFTSYSKQNLAFHGKKQIPSIVTRLTHEVFFDKKPRSPSPLRTKHRLPILERSKKSAHDGKTLPGDGEDNKAQPFEDEQTETPETNL